MEVCCKKDIVKIVSDDNKDVLFVFKVIVDNFNIIRDNFLLVDIGVIVYIFNDKVKFLNFDDKFNFVNYYIELVDGSRVCGIVFVKGRVKVFLYDLEGVFYEVFFEDVLYIFSYK